MCSDFYGKYIIKSKIGEGTFSEVFKCLKLSIGSTLAVKKLKKRYSRFSEAEGLSELLVWKKLPPHPNVLSLLEYVFDAPEGKLFMIFELMEMSLYDLIKSRKRCLPESKVKHLLYQILKGLEHLHAHGLFHRDIKPENILLKKSLVKLADLGSVRGTYTQQPYTEYVSTRWYRAPECILSVGSYGSKIDIWACGCVYYELLTSKPLFPGANEIDQLSKIHQIVGTPNTRVLAKMRRNKPRITDARFAAYPSLNLTVLLPFTSEAGRELLKRMLVYDPDLRASVGRLMDHRYFNGLRETECLGKRNGTHINKKPSSDIPLLNTGNKVKYKPKPGLGIILGEKKSSVPKLKTNSWVPSTTTIPEIVARTTRSKPDNKLSYVKGNKTNTQTLAKKGDKDNPTILPELKPTVKQTKLKSNSMYFPPIRPKAEPVKVTKSYVSSSLQCTTQSFLPPIKEQ